MTYLTMEAKIRNKSVSFSNIFRLQYKNLAEVRKKKIILASDSRGSCLKWLFLAAHLILQHWPEGKLNVLVFEKAMQMKENLCS